MTISGWFRYCCGAMALEMSSSSRAVARHRGGLQDRPVQRREGVRVLRHERLGHAERATRMAVPDILRQDMDETDLVVDRALVERFRTEEAVDVPGPHVGDHLGRRRHPQLHVAIRIEPELREVVPQQEVVHRILERNGELEPFPVLRIAIVLVLQCQRDRLTVDVLDRRHPHRLRRRPHPHGNRQRHRRQEVRRIELAVQHLVTHQRPAGCLDQRNVQPLFGIQPHRIGHDQRRCAGDRDETNLEVLLLERRGRLRRHGLQRCDRQYAVDRRHGRRLADGRQKAAACRIAREQRPDRRGLDKIVGQRLRIADAAPMRRIIDGLPAATAPQRRLRIERTIDIVGAAHLTAPSRVADTPYRAPCPFVRRTAAALHSGGKPRFKCAVPPLLHHKTLPVVLDDSPLAVRMRDAVQRERHAACLQPDHRCAMFVSLMRLDRADRAR